MRKIYFKTTDIYLAAYLIFQSNTLIEIYRESKKGSVLFVFDYTDFIDDNLFRYTNRLNFDFGDFGEEIYNLRAAIEQNLS